MKVFSSAFSIRKTDGTKPDPLPMIELELAPDLTSLTATTTNIPEITAPHTIALEIVDAPTLLLNGIDAITSAITLRVADAGRAQFAAAVGGLQLGAEALLTDVILTIRPGDADGRWSLAAPFLTITLCWDLQGTTDEDIELANGGTLTAGATATFPVCTRLLVVSPPSLFLGLPDLFAELDIEPFHLSTGWIPFDLLEDWHDILDMRGLAAWLLGLWNVDFSGYDLGYPDWDIDFPRLPRLPYDVQFQEEEFSLRKDGDLWRVSCRLKGLEMSVGGFDLSDSDLELSLALDGNGQYKIKAGIAQLQYPNPDEPSQQDPVSIALPFDLLEAQADCCLFRLGLHLVGGGGADTRFCVDTVLEIGRLRVGSRLSGDPLWQGDVRLHMRDLTIMTAEYGTPLPTFFATAEPVPAAGSDFFDHHRHPMPAMSFGEALPREKPDAANETGLALLGFDWQGPERIYLAWEQRGNQLFKALASDLLGTEAAGAIPANGETLRVGVEVARRDFGDGGTAQVRVDWIEVNSAKSPLPTVTTPSQTTVTGNCVAAAEIVNGIHLPFGTSGANLDNLVVPDPMTLSIPGLRLDVAQPSAHSLVFRHEDDESKTVSYLLIWDKGSAPKVPVALACAKIGFSLSGEDGARQVAETAKETANEPFLTAALGQNSDGGQALRVIGVRHTDGRLEAPKFLKVFAPAEGGALPPIIPAPTAAIGIDDCPPPPRPLPAHVPLGFQDFASPDILDPASRWRLSLRLGATEALLDLFGGSNNDAVDFTIEKLCRDDAGDLEIHTTLKIALVDDFVLEGTVVFGFDIEDMSLSIRDGVGLSLDYPILQGDPPAWTKSLTLDGGAKAYDYVDDVPDLFGLKLKAFRKKVTPAPTTMPILQAAMRDGKFTLRVPADTELLLRLEEVGDDGLNFRVKEFVVGPGGVDAVAEMKATTFKMPGLKNPLSLDYAKLAINNSVLQTIRVDGSTQMPELFDKAAVTVGFSIMQDPSTKRIRLRHFTCCLAGEGPIYSTGVRLKFELSKVQLVYEDDDPAQPPSLQFKVSGKLTFVPTGGELGGTLLENFKDMTLEFNDAPVSDEFFDHVQLMVTLAEPVERELFAIFRIQLRSVGFHPNYDFGNGHKSPALIFGGQIDFADVGDVASVEIDFHRIYLGFPAKGETLPAVEAKGLRVEISSGGFKIAGRVERYEDDLITGFAGEGVVQIPGLPELGAAFAFTRVRKSPNDPWQRAWFIAVEGAKISYQVAPLPLYLRQIGLGFGYRYTSPLIKTFEEEDELGILVSKMLEAVRTHQTLARIDSWVPDANEPGRSPKWTIGFETVFSMASANSDPFTYQRDAEIKLKSAIAQIVAFLRSDLTFIAAAKVWFPVSADDFFENKEGMRQRPLASGFMAYSAPKSRLLIHAASGKNPYLGGDNDPVPAQLKPAFNTVHFEATLLSERSLLHAELGWPDRLLFGLKFGALRLECRGGVLFRLERDVLIQGIYFSATAELSFSGGLNAGCIGICVSAEARFSAAVRLMAVLYLSRPLQSNIYAALGVDISVKFSLKAWLHIESRFFTLRLSVSFSFELQIVVALELGWAGNADLGFKAQARVVVGVFGRSLSVRVAASLFGSNVDKARDQLAPYMSSFLEAGSIPPIPGLEQPAERESFAALGAPRTALDAMEGITPSPARAPISAARLRQMSAPTPDTINSVLRQTDDPAEAAPKNIDAQRLFNIALREGSSKRRWYGWIMPNAREGGFFPVPRSFAGAAAAQYATLTLPTLAAGEAVYTLDDAGKWTSGGQNRQLYIRPGPAVEAEQDGVGTPSEGFTMDLRDFLAAGHVPLNPADDNKLPFDFPNLGFDIVCPETPLFEACDAVTDIRLKDPASGVQNPKRRLDVNNRYDRLVLAAMEETPPDEFWKKRPADAKSHSMFDQALGNQSFLMTTFMEDLTTLATRDDLKEGERPQGLPSDRPTLADLGLLVCVEADECPDWLCTRPVDPPAAGSRPVLAFNNAGFHPALHPSNGSTLAYDASCTLWPAIDFVEADFKTRSPRFENLVRYFDDDSLNIGWDFIWQGAPPSADLPGGALHDPEDLLDHYDIAVLVTGFSGPVKRVKAVPGDLLSKEEDPQGASVQRRVKSRYQFNVMLSDLPELRSVSLARQTSVIVNITPVAQTGRSGRTKVVEVVHKATTTPLPADAAELDLAFDAFGRLGGSLSWRVLTPPTKAGIAPAARWELVLRPIAELPMGAYPTDAVETGEAGLMSLGGGELRDGDVVIALDLENDEGITRHPPDRAGDDDRDPALERIELDLTDVGQGLSALDDRPIFDHLGQRVRLEPPHRDQPYLVAEALSFFGKVPPSAGGRGWRLFLRAHAEPLQEDVDTLPEQGYSGLSQVTLKLVRPPKNDERRRSEAEAVDNDTPSRLLEHLEWIERDPTPVTLPADALAEEHGPIQRPHFTGPENTKPFAWLPWEAPVGPVERLRYRLGDDGERGVTISWKAVIDDWPYAASSAFELYETRLDHLLSQGIKSGEADPFPDFNPHWTKIRTVAPIDLQVMGIAETSFAKPQTWWTRRQAETAAIAWQEQREKALQVYFDGGDDDGYPMARHASDKSSQTHWWSSTESELAWPSLLLDEEKELRRLAAKQSVTPMEAMRRVALIETPKAEEHAEFLAACRDLGEYLTGRRLNPYLNLLVGQLAHMGAPPVQSGVRDDAMDVSRYEVDARATLAGELPERGTTPLEWLSQVSPGVDPSGWKMLSGLGLAITVSLRDGLTRETLPQDDLRTALDAAIKQLHKRLLVAKANNVQMTAIAQVCDTHLSIVSPIHANFAATARKSDRRLDDVALSMLQLVLPPQPVRAPNTRRTAYEVFALQDGIPTEDRKLKYDRAVEFLRPDRENRRHFLEPGREYSIRDLAEPGEVILARYRWNDGGNPNILLRPFDDLLDEVRTPALRTRNLLPLAFTWPKEPAAYSPFEQFAPDRTIGLHRPGMSFEDGVFAGALTHLNHLLRPVEPERPSGVLTPQEAAAYQRALEEARQSQAAYDGALEEALQKQSEVTRLYEAFDRFFAGGIAIDLNLNHRDPTPPRTPPKPTLKLPPPSQETFHPLRVELAAPEQSEPLNLSPDSQGWLSTTHLVREDWATLRGYAVRALPRSWPLNPASQKEQKVQLRRDAGRIDVQFDRIRRVEPAKPLGIRLVGTPEYQMHEITLSEPIERSLSRPGLPLARKLDYLDFRYAPRRSFRFEDWTRHLRSNGFHVTPKEPALERASEVLEGRDATLPVLASDDTELLAEVPYARFGATVIRFAAEPFYDDQIAKLLVRAGVRESPLVTVSLLPAQPTPLEPLPTAEGHLPTVALDRDAVVAWNDLNDLPPELAGVQSRWQAVSPLLAGLSDMVRQAITKHAAPQADGYTIRQPRLAESLAASARNGHLAAELEPEGRGYVPDPDAFIELAEEAAGTRKSVAMIRSTREFNVAFRLTPSSSEHKLGDLQVTSPDAGWTDGLLLSTTVVPTPRVTPFDLRGLRKAIFNVPRQLSDPGNAAPGDSDLQLGGTLVNWGPLFTRLNARESGGGFVGTLPESRWNVRPVLPVSDHATPAPEDTASALRVLMNRHHRHALNLAARAAPDTLDDLTLPEVERLISIYDAELVVVTPEIGGDVTAIAELVNGFSGIYQLYVFLPGGAAADPGRLVEVATEQTAGTIAQGDTGTAPDAARLVVVVPALADLPDDAREALYDTLRRFEAAYPGDYPQDKLNGDPDKDFEELARFHRRAQAIAAALHAVERPAPLSVFAHRGNLPPVRWPITTVAATEDQ